MRILLTNDDGIFAPGLQALRKELKRLGSVIVVAPAQEQSGAGHSITLQTPLLIQEVFDSENHSVGWAVEGAPADCVKLAILELMSEPPDLIISGMNAGSNAGINVLYSGTVGAAIEGAFFRKTSIAISLEYDDPKQMDFPAAAKMAHSLIKQVLRWCPPQGSLININIPCLQKGPPKGVRVVPMNVTPYIERYEKRVNPRGKTYFWIGNELNCPDPHPDTDVYALDEDYVTITPLQFDLTHHVMLREMQDREWKL